MLGHGLDGFKLRGLSTAILMVQHPDWKAEQLLRYAHSEAVKTSLGANSKEYLMEQFAPMLTENLTMKGHMPNFLGFLFAKYATEQVEKYPQPLKSSNNGSSKDFYFQGRWKSVSSEKALEVFNQLTPRSADEYEAKSEQKQYAAQGEKFSVGVLPISVNLLRDNVSDLRRQENGTEVRESGFWQWDGSQLWIGSTPYHVVGEYLIHLKSDPGNVYGTILERDPEGLLGAAEAQTKPAANQKINSRASRLNCSREPYTVNRSSLAKFIFRSDALRGWLLKWPHPPHTTVRMGPHTRYSLNASGVSPHEMSNVF